MIAIIVQLYLNVFGTVILVKIMKNIVLNKMKIIFYVQNLNYLESGLFIKNISNVNQY